MPNINAKSIKFEGVEYYYNTFSTTEINEYKGLRDMYYSTGGFSNGAYLEKFPREGDGTGDTTDFFGTRKKLAHYENVFKPELEAMVDPIFSKDQVRSEVNDVIDLFVDGPTKKDNESMPEYQRRKELETKLYGSVFEVLDAPSNVALTGAQNGSSDLMPYAFYVNPLQIEGYALDQGGALAMLIYYEDIDQRNNENGTNVQSNDYTWKVWLKTPDGRNVTFNYQNESVNEETVLFQDEFPVSLLEDNTRYQSNVIAKSKYIDVLTVVKKIYNLTSWFNDSFFKNCFAFLAVNGKIPDDVDLSNDSIFMYQGEGVNAPGYVAPPTEHLEVMIEEVARLIREIKQNMNSTVSIASTASGEARMEADRRRIEKLKQDAKDIEDQEKWLVNVALTNYIDGSWDYIVVYPTDFESLTKSDELNSLQMLLDAGVSESVAKEIRADMIKIVYPSDAKRAEELAAMEVASQDTTENDTFDNPPSIEE
jgi:hypothetical protein